MVTYTNYVRYHCDIYNKIGSHNSYCCVFKRVASSTIEWHENGLELMNAKVSYQSDVFFVLELWVRLDILYETPNENMWFLQLSKQLCTIDSSKHFWLYSAKQHIQYRSLTVVTTLSVDFIHIFFNKYNKLSLSILISIQ